MKFKDLKQVSKEDREKKLKDLKMELIKSKASAAKGGAKTKEIKKIIARILTLNNEVKPELRKT